MSARVPLLHVELVGRVRGQGSLRLIRGVAGNEVATYDAAVRNYRNLLVAAIRGQWGERRPVLDPVGVVMRIEYPRPAAHFLPRNGKRAEPELRSNAPHWHVGYPDCDKVARLVDDALVAAGVIMDDKQIAALSVRDRWGMGSGRLAIEVWTLE